MSSLPTAYTPLETLLLFQALRADGLPTPSSLSIFNQISDQLKRIPLVHSDPSYDPGRLSPDALRELYLHLLKEEAKRDLDIDNQQAAGESLRDNTGSPVNGENSRKRKAPSPSLPTVQEASQHRHLIPQLVSRLYARYRENAVQKIREQERSFDALSRDSKEIEMGKGDDGQLKEQFGTDSPRPSAGVQLPSAANAGVLQSPAALNGSPAAQKLSGPEHAPSKGQANEAGYAASPAPAQTAPFPPAAPKPQDQPAIPQPSPSPHPLQTATGVGAGRPAAGTPQPRVGQGQQQQYQQQRLQQYFPRGNATPGAPPANGRPPPGYAQSPAAQPGMSYPHQQQHATPFSPHPRQPQYPIPSQQGGQQLPPFSIDPQQGARGQPAQRPAQQMAMPRSPQSAQQPIQHTYPPSAPPTVQRPTINTNPAIVSSILSALATPVRAKKPVWKSETTPSRLQTAGTQRPRPGTEPLSPIQSRAELPVRSTRSTRNRDVEVEEPPAPAPEPAEATQAPPPRRRGRPKRERSPQSVSSTVDDSARMTRSHSVSTTAGTATVVDDRPGSSRGGNVKLEPSTPASYHDDAAAEASRREPSATPAASSSGTIMTRKRAGTIQSQQQLPPSKRSKRHAEEPATTKMEANPPPAAPAKSRSNTITAYRNFSKLSATIMNDINSHKHASYFVNAVRDRDAPGYSEIIKNPQHLKSIRAAITAGTRAVTAAVESPHHSSSSSSAFISASGVEGSASSTVELERGEDFLPPRAIVNGAQLEREVMRMLANAVMFNPGDDGMVADTREMFEDVEALLRRWRGLEREGGGEGSNANAGEGESVEVVEEEGRGKRRKG